MNIDMQATYGYDGKNPTIYDIPTPDICPRCKRSIEPVGISLTITALNNFTVSYFCKGCKSNFLSDYVIKSQYGSGSRYNSIIKSYPEEFVNRVFDERINRISPNFSNIFNQSLIAENKELDEIAGMGYRKSLEFLIKDYSCFLHPDDKEQIKDSKFSLSACINKYIKADHLKDLTKLASWLGNDETHYTRMHEEQSIEDLKKYLDATIFFILYDLFAIEAGSIVNNK